MNHDGDDFTTFFETDSDQTWDGHIHQTTIKDPYDARYTYLSVANKNEPLYIKWGVRADSGGGDNPQGSCYYISGSNGVVTFNNSQSLVKNLINSGVVNSTNGATENIYVYPKFTQKSVTVMFENTDAETRYDGGWKRMYDADNRSSSFANVIEVWRKGGSKTAERNSFGVIWKTKDADRNDVYRMRLPYLSVIRLQVEPAPSATPNGVRYRTSYNSGGNVTQFTKGARKFGSSAEGALIDADAPPWAKSC